MRMHYNSAETVTEHIITKAPASCFVAIQLSCNAPHMTDISHVLNCFFNELLHTNNMMLLITVLSSSSAYFTTQLLFDSLSLER
jgi:hypothetical protein